MKKQTPSFPSYYNKYSLLIARIHSKSRNNKIPKGNKIIQLSAFIGTEHGQRNICCSAEDDDQLRTRVLLAERAELNQYQQ